MSKRTLRINELVRRELNDILRQQYQSESAALTFTGVEVAPDLRDGWVQVAIVGDADTVQDRMRWLQRQARDIRAELGRRIVLKYLPRLHYRLDETTPRANRVLELLDELETPSQSE